MDLGNGGWSQVSDEYEFCMGCLRGWGSGSWGVMAGEANGMIRFGVGGLVELRALGVSVW